MSLKNSKVIDTVLVGTGIAGLNFIDKFLEKKKIIHVISPDTNSVISKDIKNNIKFLPSQMRLEHKKVNDYYFANSLELKRNCNAIGSLNFGGLSNYWGLQIDSYIKNNQRELKKKTCHEIRNYFIEFLKRFRLVGSLQIKDKHFYSNDYSIPSQFNRLKKNKENLICRKPILAFSTPKTFKGNLNKINENKQKLTAGNLFKKMKNKNKIKIHDYYLDKISKKEGVFELFCKKNKKIKIFLTKKIVFASGTIATTKILMDYLNVKKEVKIKHHPRLCSVYLSKEKLDFNLNFAPSLFQIMNNSSKAYFTADLRPGNKLISKSITDAFPLLKPFEFLINVFRKRLIFSNFLLDSKFSNLYLKKNKKKFELFSKNYSLEKILRKKSMEIFRFLFKKGIILPFYKTFFPGNGGDYHYFGTVPFRKKGKLAVNNNCQLLSSKNIYVIDGSVFDFRINKYPLGIVAANARRIAKKMSK